MKRFSVLACLFLLVFAFVAEASDCGCSPSASYSAPSCSAQRVRWQPFGGFFRGIFRGRCR